MRCLRALAVLLPVAVVVACGASHPAATGPASAQGGASTAPSNPPGVFGYLYASPTAVAYLRWQTDSSGDVQGSEDAAAITGAAPNLTVDTRTDDTFTGTISNNTITLNIDSHTDTGTLATGTLTLEVSQSDGSIQAVTYRAADPAAYNQALAALYTTVQQQNTSQQHANDQSAAEQQHANDQSAAEQQLAQDFQALGSEESSLTGDLSSLGKDATTTGNDLATERSDEQKVLTEAGNGTANSTVCDDSNGVAGDANGIYGDGNGLSGDLNSTTGALSGLRQMTSNVQGDLKTVEGLVPGYQGAPGEPSPAQAAQAVSSAEQAAVSAVHTANADIDQVNGDMATAYTYAVDAAKSGNCNTPNQPNPPIGHIS